NRIESWEEAGSDVGADKRNRGVAARFFVGNAVSGVNLYIVDGRYVLSDALDVDTQGGIPLKGDARLPRGRHSDAFHERGFGLDELEFLRLYFRISLHHLEKLFGIPGAEPGHANDTESVRSHVGHFLGDVHIHAVD